MRTIALIAAAATFAAPVAAQDASERWEVIGVFEATVAGDARTLRTFRDVEGEEIFATTERGPEGTVISLTASDFGRYEAPVRPSLTVVIGPFDDAPGTAELEYLTTKAIFMAGEEGGAPVELRDVRWDPETGALAFAVEAAELREMNPNVPATETPRPLAGGRTIALSGTFEGAVPAAD